MQRSVRSSTESVSWFNIHDGGKRKINDAQTVVTADSQMQPASLERKSNEQHPTLPEYFPGFAHRSSYCSRIIPFLLIFPQWVIWFHTLSVWGCTRLPSPCTSNQQRRIVELGAAAGLGVFPPCAVGHWRKASSGYYCKRGEAAWLTRTTVTRRIRSTLYLTTTDFPPPLTIAGCVSS